jgi:6-pyruvoyltetrahydropterin/6-carboxytetrahydropterin synthase
MLVADATARHTGCVRVARRVEFAAAHHLAIPDDPERSRALFGRGAEPPGHGHNYEVWVTVESEVDSTTGFGLNVAELKSALAETVVKRLDGRHLVEDVPELRDVPATTEMLAVLIWRWLTPYFTGCPDEHRTSAARLVSVRVAEHPRLWAEYCGE